MDHRLGRVESEIVALRSELNSRFVVLTWAVGINAAVTIAILGALLHGIKYCALIGSVRWFALF